MRTRALTIAPAVGAGVSVGANVTPTGAGVPRGDATSVGASSAAAIAPPCAAAASAADSASTLAISMAACSLRIHALTASSLSQANCSLRGPACLAGVPGAAPSAGAAAAASAGASMANRCCFSPARAAFAAAACEGLTGVDALSLAEIGRSHSQSDARFAGMSGALSGHTGRTSARAHLGSRHESCAGGCRLDLRLGRYRWWRLAKPATGERH